MNKKLSLVPKECHECSLRVTNSVCRAGNSDHPTFQQFLHRFLYKPRQIVFYEGHEPMGLYVLCSGKVKLTSYSKTGHQHNTSIVGAGELIERSGFCEGILHAVTCETLEPSQVCLIERIPYLEMLKKNPSQAIEILQLVSGKDQQEKVNLGQLPFCKTDERLATVLLDLGERFGKQEAAGIRLDVQLTREELAALANMAPETLMRLLAQFKKDGLIATMDREITLLDSGRLAHILNS